MSNPANQTKDNLQADSSDPKYAESVQIVNAAFGRSREFLDFALPKQVAPPLLCRYRPGMKYGSHADSALIQLSNSRLRSDLSCTVFVNDTVRLRGGRIVDRDRQSGHRLQGRGRRGDRLPVDAAARSRFRCAPATGWCRSPLSKASSPISTSVRRSMSSTKSRRSKDSRCVGRAGPAWTSCGRIFCACGRLASGRSREDRGERRVGARLGFEPGHALADFGAVVAAATRAGLPPAARGIGVLGRFGVAREHRALRRSAPGRATPAPARNGSMIRAMPSAMLARSASKSTCHDPPGNRASASRFGQPFRQPA